jgi:hypothetical protein
MVARSLAAALAAGVVLLASGCGSETSPADDVPALATSLDRVDEAIATGEYDAARDAVAKLTDVATRAEAAGDLDAARADRIVAAAEALLAAFPEPEAPPSEPTPDPTPGEDDGEDNDDDEEESAPAPVDPPGQSGKKPHGPKKPKDKGKH